MDNIKTWFGLAAAAVIAGAGALLLPDALEQEHDHASVVPAVTCEEWRQWMTKAGRRERTQWMAIRQNKFAALPEVFNHSTAGDRVLGARTDRRMILTRSDCHKKYKYRFDYSATVDIGGNSWRSVRITASPILLRSWELYADENTGVVWIGGYNDGIAACAAAPGLTAANCRDIVSAHARLGDCWEQSDTTLCRHGLTAAGAPCSPDGASTWIPCRITLGDDFELIKTEASLDLSGE